MDRVVHEYSQYLNNSDFCRTEAEGDKDDPQ
jgi:hypothetical protein